MPSITTLTNYARKTRLSYEARAPAGATSGGIIVCP